jgi:hypothetical protein
MQIVVNTTTDIVQYSGPEGYFSFRNGYLISSDFMDSNCTPENYQIISGVTLPAVFANNAYTYANGVFTLTNAGLLPNNGVPQTVTSFQAKAALANAGLYTAVNAYMTTTASQIDQLAWQEQTTFNRNDAIIASLMAPLNLTSTQLDQLFIAAAQITP